MTSNLNQYNRFEKLRKQAEKLIQPRSEPDPETSSEFLDLIHELKIHQAELEIQNQELKRSQQELSELHQKYVDLYEFAPCGYITLDPKGIIQLINLAGATILGISRNSLTAHNSFSNYVANGWKTTFREILNDSAKNRERKRADLKLDNEMATSNWVRMDVQPEQNKIGTVVQWQITLTDITERKQMEEKLEEMSIYDSLTGLYNRNFFEEEMQRLSDRRHNPLGFIICDLDGLKSINDTLGHQFGDQMIVNTADILRRNLRSSDIIARIGGDEFAVLLPQTPQEEVEQLIQRLHLSVEESNNAQPDSPVTLSMGYAIGEGSTVDKHSLYSVADNRMYGEKIQRKESARSSVFRTLTKSMQTRDFYTEGHCDRLLELAASLVRTLEISKDFINDLFLLARFHDLGKLAVPDHILFKQGALNEEEWKQMRQHCEVGHRIASSIPELAPIADFILKHHECWDGRGYPLGLSGVDIPLHCRILSIIDAYDAMTSERPYRNPMTREEALEELKRCSGTQFDPDLLDNQSLAKLY